MTGEERFALVNSKVERADSHFRELQSEVRAFFQSNPYEVVGEKDPDTRQISYYVKRSNPIPLRISVIVGDIFQNLRSSLDHLAQHLYLVGTGDATTGTHIYFPTDSSASQYKANSPAKVRGMRQDAIDALAALEPYDGGKGQDFSVLNRLNRIDKHRLLITVGSFYRSVDIGPESREMSMAAFRPPWLAEGERLALPKFSMRLFPADPLCGLKVGDKIYTGPPDVEMKQQSDFAFGIALNEPGVVECESLLKCVNKFGALVGRTVGAFRPLLA